MQAMTAGLLWLRVATGAYWACEAQAHRQVRSRITVLGAGYGFTMEPIPYYFNLDESAAGHPRRSFHPHLE